jgi:hypothetical protein
MAGAVGTGAGAGAAVGGCVIAGAVVLVGAGGGGAAGVLGGGGVFGAGAGVGGGGASVIKTASTVFSVMRTTLRAKPEEMAQSNRACRTTTPAMPAKCLRGERCRAA